MRLKRMIVNNDQAKQTQWAYGFWGWIGSRLAFGAPTVEFQSLNLYDVRIILYLIIKAMFSQLILALLVIFASAATNCAQADEIECLSSTCPNYYYINSTCILNATSTCTTTGYVPYNNACVHCPSLASNNCSQICPDYLYQAAAGSGPSSCTSCQSLFGESCIRCTSSNCLICAYSSNLALATDKQSCLNNNCTVPNCLVCYSGASRCYKCKSGYIVNANFQCEVSPCSITNCITCSTSKCANCFPGYALSADQNSCEAQCSDINCVNCIAPQICGTCTTAYYPNSNGLCVIDCSQIGVANCMECASYSTCTKCNSGYDLINGGSLCTPSCSVSNCQNCVSGDTTTCQNCKTGYDLASSGKTCTEAVCYIEYCQACNTISTCLTCIAGFTLSVDNKTCNSNCTATLPNCVLCTSSRCISCKSGYQISSSSGQCQLVCSSITNCISCFSPTLCSSCADGYTLSSDYRSCTIVCKVRGCSVCTSSTSNSCQTCQSGYTPATNSNGDTVCKRNCRPGQINTSPSSINCENCQSSVLYCNTCSYQNSQVVCDSCMAGYFVNGFRCDKCSDAISDCLRCDNAVTCTRCIRGYRVIDGACSNNSCSASVTNCYSCRPSTPSSCYRCNPGYFVNTAGQCELKTCANSYVFDEDTKTCVCPIGTYELSGACYPCADPNCQSCTVSVCLSCAEGYYPVGTTCQPCISNCKYCTSGSNCQKCERRYSLNSEKACVAFGGGRNCAVSPLGIFYRCDSGCRTCIAGASNNQIVICLIPEDGYSIVGGVITKCDASCQSCSSYTPTLCTSCYPRFTLVSGECVACGDSRALTCSSYNTNYSLTCEQGYTAVYFSSSSSTGGSCLACADYCSQCNSRGPGQCDEGQCNSGSVQLLGTTNCSLCFSGCVKCSNSDPNNCLDCGSLRYIDSQGLCQQCATGCKTCQTTASNCLTCEVGFWLVGTSCASIPQNCVSLDSAGVCNACFSSYVVNTATNTCDPDVSCSSSGSCVTCPDQYYLFNSTCLQCSLAASSNCIACLSTNITQCLRCADGYYLDSSYACQTCTANCQTCDSSTFCTKASSGYYISLLSDGGYSGVVEQCASPCATCIDHSDFCLSCESGYFLYGSNCQRSLYLIVTIIFGQSSGGSIFSNTDSADRQLFLSIRSFNRIGNAIYSNAPSRFRDSFGWRRHTKFRKFRYGSVAVEFTQGAGQFTSGTEASSQFTNYLASANFDGFNYVSSSMTAQGFSTSSSSSTSLGLVLGLSIPLSILLILVIVLTVYTCRKDKTDYEEDGNKNGFYSEDIIEKADDL